VQNDVQELRKKLEGRKKLTQVDEGVERAKGEVVRCLRDNDRRPLDCWREVEAFKEEVRRLEVGWVEKVVR
jgi:altered-inheritance-of-mitochondria protein 13